ncbi:TcfC E-set like domain-containing protein [Aliivibrio logei]|nr:TcfC E-set like domain-containing protein [Aliivibrio logei]
MRKFDFIILCLALMFFNTFNVMADTGPEGFEDAFTLQEKELKVRNLDGTLSQPIVFLTSFNTVKLTDKSVQSFTQYLDNNSISEPYRTEIIKKLLKGIQDTYLCTGKIDECEIYPETYEIVQNYNDNQLYLFVSPKVISYSNGNQSDVYHAAKSDKNGLINSFDLYVSQYNDQDSNLSLNDNVILGLPYGYFESDFNLSSNDGSSELYEAAYHLDINAYALKVGHFSYNPDMNATDFLNNTSRLSQNSITFGSSQKLLVGGDKSNKLLSFYVPKSGNIEIYRDERLIYQRNVSEGQNSVSYNELPTGRYSVRVDVLSSGELLNSQVFQVYNNKNDALKVGDVDFSISAGLFASSHYDNIDVDIENDAYTKGLFGYQLIDSLLIGVGGLMSENDSMVSAGATYYWLDTGLSSEVVYSDFGEASYLNANLSILGFSVSYDEFDNENDDDLATFMYGAADYSRFSFNASYSLSRGQSIYGVYSLTENTSFDSNGSSDIGEKQQFLSLGYSSPFIAASRININADYTAVTNNTRFNVLWTIPLSDTVEAITGVTVYESEVTQFSTSVRKDNLLDSDAFNSSLEVTNTYDRQQEDLLQEAQITAAGNTNYARMNMTGNVSTNGSKGITAGLSSTQIITSDDVYITDRSASSYTLIDIDNGDKQLSEDREKGYFSLKTHNDSNSNFVVYEDETIVPLQEYNMYQGNFDSESVELYNSGESQVKVFTHPGTVATISPKVSRIVSFVTSFNDLSENPVGNVTCTGDGCLNVLEVTDGVYRVTVLEGLNFELTSNQNNCLLPYELTSTTQMNFGQNYCLPTYDGNEIKLVDIESEDESLKAVFLGAYEDSDKVTQAIIKLKLIGYKVIQKDIGNLKAVYIAQTQNKMETMLVKYKKEVEYIKLLAKINYSADAISYPIAQLN